MAYTVRYDIKKTHVEAEVSGEVNSFAELAELIDDFTNTLAHSGRTRFLQLERDLRLNISVYDVVEISNQVNREMRHTLGLKIACSYAPDNREINEAFETCHRNRSLNFRAFPSRKEAENWLLS